MTPVRNSFSRLLSTCTSLLPITNSKLRTSPHTVAKGPFSNGPAMMYHNATWVNKANASEITSKYDTFLLDCDGVLWATDHFTQFPNTVHTMSLLHSLGKRCLFVTNNSIPTRQELVEKFGTLGGFRAELDEVYSVAYVAGLYLKNVAKARGKCYLMGSSGMKEEFDCMGIEHVGYGEDTDPVSLHPDDLMAQLMHNDVDSVAVGFDIHFGYNKVFKAASYLQNAGCHYIATNDQERSILLGGRRRQPLTGVMVEAVNTTAARRPVVIGKPHKHLLDCIHVSSPGIDLERTVMVGDSLKTDVAFANNAGIDSILVLSGATTREQLDGIDFSHTDTAKPTYILESFADFHMLS